MKILITGAAGFIGFHVSQRLALSGNAEVLGIDNLNDYYSVALKEARVAELAKLEKFRFACMYVAVGAAFIMLYSQVSPDYVVHRGAQAGVGYSLQNPAAYVNSNLIGFFNVLEAARALPPKHLVFASSSSVYGADASSPFRESAPVGKPLSFYAATKQANESMAYNHSRNHGLNITGLRFFTAYGPWGRPDMTPILFANAIRSGAPIKLYNHGLYRRDFTYIDDIVDGILKALLYPPVIKPDPQYRVFNLGHNHPVEMIHFVELLEEALGKKALLEMLPPQPTEMPETCADLSAVQAAIPYSPKISLEEGVKRFVAWHREFYP